MSITINTTPNDIDFSRNAIGFKVTGSEYITNTPRYAYNRFRKTGATNVGDTLGIEFGDYDLDFEFVASPDDSGLQLTAGAGIDTLIEELNLNYTLTRFYSVTKGDTDRVDIVAKNYGSEFNPTVTHTGSWFTSHSGAPNESPVYSENYNILAQLFVEETYDSGTFTKLQDILLEPNSDNQVKMLVGRLLESFFAGERDLPSLALATFSQCTKTLKKYYVKFGERYGSTPAVYKLEQTDTLRAIIGRYPFMDFPGHDFFGNMVVNKQLLTFLPDIQRVWLDSYHYMYFFNFRNTGNCTFHIDVYYSDGTTDNKEIVSSINEDEIYVVPSGVGQLDLESLNPSKTIIKLRFSIIANGGYIIETSRHYYEIVPRPANGRMFLFENNFGVFDTLLCEGYREEAFETEGEEHERYLEHDYDEQDGQYLMETKKNREHFAISSGFKTLDEARALKDLLSNRMVYYIDEDNDRYIPVIVDPGSVKIASGKDDVHAVSFSYKYAFER